MLSCLAVSNLCDPVDSSPSSFSVHGILQARILEWVPSPGDLPNPGIELGSPVLQADSLPTELLEKPSRYKVGFICISLITNVVVVQLLCCVCLFATSWTAAHQASLPFTISLSLLRLMSIELMILSNRLILCHSLLLQCLFSSAY